MGAKQAGPLLRRVVIDGATVFLPVNAVLSPPYPKDGTDEEKQQWHYEMEKPLGGAW